MGKIGKKKRGHTYHVKGFRQKLASFYYLYLIMERDTIETSATKLPADNPSCTQEKDHLLTEYQEKLINGQELTSQQEMHNLTLNFLKVSLNCQF